MNKIIIQYQTQVLSNKNNQTEMNYQLQKMKKPYNQITHNEATIKKQYHKNKS